LYKSHGWNTQYDRTVHGVYLLSKAFMIAAQVLTLAAPIKMFF